MKKRYWPWAHHFHRYATTLKRVSLDCAGEEVPWFRCCRCTRIIGYVPVLKLGVALTTGAYYVTNRDPRDAADAIEKSPC